MVKSCNCECCQKSRTHLLDSGWTEQVCKLQNELALANEQIKYWEDKEVDRASCCVDNEQENIKLKEANKVLRDAVEFYSKFESWTFDIETGRTRCIRHDCDEALFIGGKKAREALASADKILKGEL